MDVRTLIVIHKTIFYAFITSGCLENRKNKRDMAAGMMAPDIIDRKWKLVFRIGKILIY